MRLRGWLAAGLVLVLMMASAGGQACALRCGAAGTMAGVGASGVGCHNAGSMTEMAGMALAAGAQVKVSCGGGCGLRHVGVTEAELRVAADVAYVEVVGEVEWLPGTGGRVDAGLVLQGVGTPPPLLLSLRV